MILTKIQWSFLTYDCSAWAGRWELSLRTLWSPSRLLYPDAIHDSTAGSEAVSGVHGWELNGSMAADEPVKNSFAFDGVRLGVSLMTHPAETVSLFTLNNVYRCLGSRIYNHGE